MNDDPRILSFVLSETRRIRSEPPRLSLEEIERRAGYQQQYDEYVARLAAEHSGGN